MLHIVNRSPLSSNSLDAVDRFARSGAVLLIEDAVYAATRSNAAAEKITAMSSRLKVYALGPDLEAAAWPTGSSTG
ncbi:MAG: sulfurtransferase complex subunit TusB [Burkholderiaceae bacterium]